MSVAQPKVNNFDKPPLSRGLQQKVLRLQVSVRDFIAVQLLHSPQDLMEKSARLFFVHVAVLNDVVKHLTTAKT